MRPFHTHLIKTKLEPPRLKDHILFRLELSKRLKQMIHFPITLVQSGPGYGKSTAIASFLSRESHAYCWYGITETDDHLYPFLHYLIEALRTKHPTFALEWKDDVLQKLQLSNEQDIYTACSHFINECMQITEECLVVLDDFHLADHSYEVETFMKWLLLHLPEHIHLVLISRSRPKWELLTRLKVKGSLLEIKEQDFIFKEDEISILFEDHYDIDLPPQKIKQIFHKTEGWIMAIQMIWQQLNNEKDIEHILDNRTDSMDELFQYMVQEVLEKQRESVQSFLKSSAILDSISIHSCEQILQRNDIASILDYLNEKNLFIFSIGEQEYRYHALFKEFLLQQLKKEYDRFVQLHTQAGEYYMKQRQVEQAIFHFKVIEDFNKIAQLIQEEGHILLKQSHLESFLNLLDILPEQIKDQHPLIWSYQGDIYRCRSMFEQALRCYQRAEDQARRIGDTIGESMGVEGEARVYLDTIQPKHAEELLERAIQLLEAEANHSASQSERFKERLILLYGLMAENSINLGRAKEAKGWYDKSRRLQMNIQMDDLDARIHLRTGRLMYTKKLLEKQKLKELQEQQERLPRSHRETNLILSLVYSFLGEAEKAKRSAVQGIMQGVKNKSPFVEACGWMRMGHAVQLYTQQDSKLADQCYQTALAIMEEIKMSRGKAEPFMGLCLLYGRKKNLQLALQYGDQGLKETMKVDDLWLSTMIRLSKGIAYACSRHLEEALEQFSSCQQDFQQCGDSYGFTVSLLWQAYLYHQIQDWNQFYKYVNPLLKHIEIEQLDSLFQQRTMFGPADIQALSPMLLDAQKKAMQNPYLDQLIIHMGMEDLSSHPGYTLRIQTLGGFNVCLGEQLVQEKDWKREKAKELFQLLITKRKHLLPKEEIYAVLYRDQAEQVAERDFKVALNTLNNVLEPQRKARSTPFYIQRHGHGYGLNLASSFELDAAEFERGVLKGLNSTDKEQVMATLEQALGLYQGDYLPERMHEDWCIEERERLQVLFIRGAERLAHLYVERNEFNAAISWCEKIIVIDKCWEEAYRLFMLCYLAQDNRSMAVRCYQRCQQVLMEELGLEPLNTTTKLFEKVTKGAKQNV